VGREVHRVALELRPVALDDLGLARALAGYLEAWQARTGVPVDWVALGIEERRLPDALETTVYRTVQEAMNNVYKHAAAKAVSVSVERRGDRVITIIEDDGVGFDADAVDWANDLAHLGLVGMQERALIVDGELTVASTPGHGTTIRLTMPLATT
jgi:signal transduction histidine kinase